MDRNNPPVEPAEIGPKSLSARRAWIEISSLDDILAGVNESLSARRAWIEIKTIGRLLVAVRRRSPQGERG